MGLAQKNYMGWCQGSQCSVGNVGIAEPDEVSSHLNRGDRPNELLMGVSGSVVQLRGESW